MMILLVALTLMVQAPAASTPIRITVQSETNLAPQFIDTLKDEGKAIGLSFEVVDRGNAQIDYQIYLAQETTVGSAAAAVIVLDRSGGIALSVVRSGRLSGKGAINACTKEVAKRLAILRK